MKTLCFWLACLVPTLASTTAPDPAHFKVEVLASGFVDPLQMAMLPNGHILICERTGGLMEWTPGSNQLHEIGKLNVESKKGRSYAREDGFIGLAADPHFAKNGWIYCYYSRTDKSVNQLSRFTLRNDKLDLTSERRLLQVATDRGDNTCHEAGCLTFGPKGLLYLATGDNTNPFSFPPSPIEEKIKTRDSQRSASNSNDLRGKILRIKINDNGTYSIPPGNLFPPGTPKTRPEIYTMGLRNPFRITVNQKTGTLFWNEVAPDKHPTAEEINEAKTAGYYGWPYVIADDQVFHNLKGVPYDPKHLRNTSINNTGIVNLPVPREPIYFYNRSCSIMGDIYHTTNAPDAFPNDYDNCLFFADWNQSWFKYIRLDRDEHFVSVNKFPLNFKFRKPINMFFHDGNLYVLEYGNGWYNVKSGRLLKISYSTQFHQELKSSTDPRIAGMDENMRGTKFMLTATCLSCHNAQKKIIGPSFVDIAAKYKGVPGIVAKLVDKVKNGGAGVWGQQAMPAHDMYTVKQIRQMVLAVLKTKRLTGHAK